MPQPEQEESAPPDSGSPDSGGAEPDPSDSGGSASTESIEEGNWTLSNVQPSSASDSCSSSFTLFSDAMGIGNSEEFNIVYENPNQFLWTQNQDTYTCTVQNSSFSCSSVSQTIDLSSSSFPMILEETRTYAGDILDSTTMDVELSLNIESCQDLGTDNYCDLLASFGIVLPCTVIFTGEASYNP